MDTSDDRSEEIDYTMEDDFIYDHFIADDCVYTSSFVAADQEPSNLKKLRVEHRIDTEGLLKIINQTPQLRYLFVQSLKKQMVLQDISIIPKLPKLTKLIIEDFEGSCKSLTSLLDTFDCQLKTLKIGTSSFDDDQEWRQLMKTRLYGLETFTIRLKRELMDIKPYYSVDFILEKGTFNCMRFISDSFWYDHGWVAKMRIDKDTVEAVFHRPK
ncbi:unnamed protein product [Adineta steineri]|nr:unnamed protein product [Adineta steineri]CAF1646666.1 unnamed protein product [Adineta steineri]